ncbi:ABC transporter ATP-binding protein [Paenibacillus sp. EZ-K15]|uniref:ABC transporter ATP-binding protein n=1 Tax=Paenibacillus sp. EZ-K15 TaxID=2044275 RepID=UPI000BF748C2|nr:ABC transporter ATP-binding protein [Paenibacillus sp. EZ-K15]
MIKSLPQEVIVAIQPHEPYDVIYWMLCDRSLDGEGFASTYLILSKEKLFVVSFQRDKANVESIDIDNIETAFTVNLIASGLIVLQEDEERIIGAFTNGQMGSAAKFVSIFTKIKKKEDISDEEVEDRQENITCPKCGMRYPEEGRQICPKCMKKHAIFSRLLRFAGQYKFLMFFIVLFMLLNSATGLAIPYLQGTVLFDQALGNTGDFAGRIGLVIVLIFVFRTISLLFGILFSTINARLAANVVFDLKASVFAAMQRLSLSFFQKKQTGQLMTRVSNDAQELQYFFVDGISYFIVNAMNIIGITTIMLIMDWKLTLICFIPIPFVLLLIRWVFPKLWRLSWRRHRRVSTLNAMISDTIQGTRVVKAFGKERQELERFQRANSSYSESEQSFNLMSSTIFPILTILTQFGGILIWAFGGWRVMQGSISFGEIMTFISYIYMLYGPLQFMNNIVNWWSSCMSAAQRIFEIQDSVSDVAEKEDAVALEHMNGDIRLSHVTFGYEPNKLILKDVSLHAKPGQMIGVVGHSGAGKSTLVNLISRLYDVTDGEIVIDGVNVKDLQIDTMRKNIGIVSQELYVFMGTIAENIAYADPECSLDDIINAARIANAHDFIEKLPDGYDTIVGTGGHILSGGEKQRISIARAVLHNPQILILDEATASLDTETELQIQEALETLIQGRTTIAIAHRLSTLRNADYLLVMDGGKVVEEGTHEQLMMLKGVYHGLVQKHDEALSMRRVG